MTVNQAVLTFASAVVLTSLALALWLSPWWLLLTAFASLNLMQARVTGFCLAARVFRRLGGSYFS